MALFSRFRRMQQVPHDVHPAEQLRLPAVLPRINQRITVTTGEHEPVSSRVDDETDDALLIASPNLPLDMGDPVVLTWEVDDCWYSLQSSVLDVHHADGLPTVSVARVGRLSRFEDRRTDLRRRIALPIDVRVVVARVVKPGRTLRTHTIELGGNAVRFTTSAPFAPGDVLEVKIVLREGDTVSARVKVIRMDSVSGSWRQTCSAVYDEMLRTDRNRIVHFLEQDPSELHLPESG